MSQEDEKQPLKDETYWMPSLLRGVVEEINEAKWERQQKEAKATREREEREAQAQALLGLYENASPACDVATLPSHVKNTILELEQETRRSNKKRSSTAYSSGSTRFASPATSNSASCDASTGSYESTTYVYRGPAAQPVKSEQESLDPTTDYLNNHGLARYLQEQEQAQQQVEQQVASRKKKRKLVDNISNSVLIPFQQFNTSMYAVLPHLSERGQYVSEYFFPASLPFTYAAGQINWFGIMYACTFVISHTFYTSITNFGPEEPQWRVANWIPGAWHCLMDMAWLQLINTFMLLSPESFGGYPFAVSMFLIQTTMFYVMVTYKGQYERSLENKLIKGRRISIERHLIKFMLVSEIAAALLLWSGGSKDSYSLYTGLVVYNLCYPILVPLYVQKYNKAVADTVKLS